MIGIIWSIKTVGPPGKIQISGNFRIELGQVPYSLYLRTLLHRWLSFQVHIGSLQ